MRSCSSPTDLFGPQVSTVHVTISSPLVGDFHVSHKPAMTMRPSSAMPIE